MKKIKLKALFYPIVGIIFVIIILNFYSTFSLNNEGYKIESVVYDISDDYIENISSNTSIDLFSKYFDLENCTIKVVTEDGKEIKDGFVINGSKTVVYDSNDVAVKTYTNIIKGDFINDGIINEVDLNGMAKCLVDDCSLADYQLKSLDLDLDNELHTNDLLLLDKALTLGYEKITLDTNNILLQSEEQGRLVATVTPNYGINQNAKWTSLDESVATVDEAGRVIGHNEGTTKVQASTQDGQFIAEATVKVDNTIQLASHEGVAYIGGNDLKIKMKLINYENVTCTPTNSTIASCSIEGEYLVMKALDQGDTDILVSTEKYGEATFKLTTYSTYLNVMPKHLCTTPGNTNFITVSGFNSGELSFTSSDESIITNAYMQWIEGRRWLRIEVGSKQGRATLNVKEANGNKVNDVVIDVTTISIPEIGRAVYVGDKISTLIDSGHIGELTCVSQDESIATCSIEGNQLIVETHATGNTNIDVYNKFLHNGSLVECGKTNFLVVVWEKEESEG